MFKTKKLLSIVMVFAFVISIVPVTDLRATTSGETLDGTETSPTNKMLHFVVSVRWGNVIGESTDSDKSNFDGSVSVSSSARVSLERTLLFERHNVPIPTDCSDTDSSEILTCDVGEVYIVDNITKRKDPVSWNSLIYGHWDGVKVLISSPANDNVIIKTNEGTVTMTAQAFYDLSEPYIEDVGEGREIVVKVYPIKDPKYFLKVLWGKTSRADYAIRSEEASEVEVSDATVSSDANTVVASSYFKKTINNITWHDAFGSFQINGGGEIKLVRPLRFERNDKIILSNSKEKIEWTSYVAQGVDGILTRLNLDTDSLDDSDTVTLSFTKAGWSKDFSVIDLYHDRMTLAKVAEGYGVILQVWKRPNRSLIRVRGTNKVYMIEDGVKQWIPTPEVLESQGLSFDNVEDVDVDEAATYGDAEEVCYADGSMVREEGTEKVYVIADGEKKHITDPTAFAALGYKWGNVVVVKPGALSFYRLRTAMRSNSVHPEGALIREDGTNTVYLIEGGKKKPISSLNIFNARRLNWNKVLVVNKAQMNKFQLGATLKYPDGALVKDSDGKVYIMDKGEKRWVRSGDDLTGAGYSSDDIIEVINPTEVADLEETKEGYDIVADDIIE